MQQCAKRYGCGTTRLADDVARVGVRCSSVEDACCRAGKAGDGGIKARAVGSDEGVASVHGADGGFEMGAACVLKAFARGERGLFADDAFAFDFFDVAVGVGDDPMPRNELYGKLAGVDDVDVIREGVDVARGVALVGQIEWRRINRYGIVHFRLSTF